MAQTSPVLVQPLQAELRAPLSRALHKLKHDLSNGLVAAMGEMELLASDVEDVELAERLHDARSKLLRPFLDLRRMTASLPVAEEAVPRWVDTRQQLDARARSLEVKLDWQPLAVEHLQRDGALRAIVGSLVTNALDAATPGVSVRVVYEERGGACALAVSDDGPGCSNLEAAARGGLQRPGGAHLGLGLAVAASLIADRGGQVTIAHQVPSGFLVVASWPGG